MKFRKFAYSRITYDVVDFTGPASNQASPWALGDFTIANETEGTYGGQLEWLP